MVDNLIYALQRNFVRYLIRYIESELKYNVSN